jgi:hypothetical protein
MSQEMIRTIKIINHVFLWRVSNKWSALIGNVETNELLKEFAMFHCQTYMIKELYHEIENE